MTKRPHNNLETIKRVLGTDYLEHEIIALRLEEDFDANKSRIRLELVNGDKTPIVVEGEGVGMVDAFTHGLTQRFGAEYQSLGTIEFSAFRVSAHFDTKKEQSGSDAIGEVELEVRNSEGERFHFSDASRSIAASAARAVLAAVEYFVNAERAYITLYKALKDARDRDRPDLVGRYTRELSEVVKSTSYTEVIDRIRREVE